MSIQRRSHSHRRRLASPLYFADTFTRDDGPLGNGWTAAATWAISSNRAKNTPNLGAELLANNEFANWTADDPDDWNPYGESGNDPEISEAADGETHADTPTPGGGMCNIYTTGAIVQIAQGACTANNWYRWAFTVNAAASGSAIITSLGVGVTSAAPADYHGASYATGISHIIRRGGLPTDVTLSTASLKALTLPELFATQDFHTPNVDASVEYYSTHMGHCGGLVLCLDNPASPANYLIAYVYNNPGASCRIYMHKCVAGHVSHVANAITSYVPGAPIRVLKTGATVQFYYNANLITTETVEDASLINNSNHGLLSTADVIGLDNFSIVDS